MWPLFYFFCAFIIASSCQSNHKVHYLEPGDNLVCCENWLKTVPQIYCYKGKSRNIIHLWETIQLHLSLPSNEFEQFDGYSPEDVMSQIENQKSSWNFNIYTTKKKVIKLNSFNNTCIGVITKNDYNVKLNRIRVDYWKVLSFLFGLILFFMAPKLSSNSLFYYICGVSFGTCASLLIFIYILGRLMPKKPMMYSFLVGGWTVGLYLVQLLWDNFRTIALEYQSYVIYYLIITGIISFIICYRLGPVSDPRSVNIIKWLMQGVSFIFIFMSSDFKEATLLFNILLLLGCIIPSKSVFRIISKVWSRPKPRKLLSDNEYHKQGAVETKRALDDLRGYCSSPECNQWRTVLTLKDPQRFAKFVEGSSHLIDEEVLAFETSAKDDDLLTDDSSFSD